MLTAPLVGTILAFGGSSAPDKYVLCHGQELDRVTYATLFAVIGTSFGGGNGVSTFNVPDLRGEFLRGWDASKGVDPGRVFGSSQSGAIQSHVHDQSYYNLGLNTSNGGYALRGAIGGSTAPTSATGGSETRPRNVAVNYIICTGQ